MKKNKSEGEGSLSAAESSYQASEEGEIVAVNDIRLMLLTANPENIQHQPLRLFVAEHLPFRLVHSPKWKALICLIQPRILKIPISREFLRR